MAGGRPKKYTTADIEEIKQKLVEYIEVTDIPIIAEFAYKNRIPRHRLYDYEEFSTLIKEMIDKKEANLERMGLNKEVDRTMAVFSLKQLGWSDRQGLELTGKDGGPIEIDSPRDKIASRIDSIASRIRSEEDI